MTSGASQSFVMEDGGRYSEHHQNSFSVADHLIPFVCEAADAASATSVADSSMFTYCDFGSADGGTGSVVAKALIDRVKAMNNSKPIHIVFEDQPENDFSPIFVKHQHEISGKFEDIYVSVIGRSFYRQCLPPESVDISFSSLAVQWPDFGNETEHEPSKPFDLLGTSFQWRNKAKSSNDWERYLVHRAHELKTNGQLVVAHFLFPSDMKGSSPTDVTYRELNKVHHYFFEIYEELQNEGHLSPDENFTNPEKFRTMEELEAPFLQDSSPVQKAGLRLSLVKKVVIPCPIAQQFSDGRSSKAEYGYAVATSIKSWSYWRVVNSLKAERSKEEKDLLVKEIYTRLAKHITAKMSVPTVGLPYPLAILVAQKVRG